MLRAGKMRGLLPSLASTGLLLCALFSAVASQEDGMSALKTTACSAEDKVCLHQHAHALRTAIMTGFQQPNLWRTWPLAHANATYRPQFGRWALAAGSAKAPAPDSMHDRWIVITTINTPTDAIKAWAQLTDWKVVVVADKKTPTDWSWPGVVFLSVEQQLKLGYQSVHTIPWRNYARKMVGYLYAIQHGAQVIYETDDDNAPKPGVDLKWVMPEQGTSPCTKPWSGAQNPYAYFGHCNLWPRGYPLHQLLQEGVFYCYNLDFVPQDSCPAVRSVQQGLADLDPDMDAIWRLVRGAEIGKVRFTSRPDGLSYSMGSFSPYNSQNTIHYRSAFWAMFLPTTVSMRVTDIWRSYWAQRLLWEAGQSLHFAEATVDQVRNPHDYLDDFKLELQMYVQTPTLIEFLSSWKCDYSNMFDCMLQLAYEMALNDFWGLEDVVLMEAWIQDLASFGYQPPQVVRMADVEAKLPVEAKPRPKPALLGKQILPSEARVGLMMDALHQCKMYEYKPGPDEATALQVLKKDLAPKESGRPIYLSVVMATHNTNQAGQHHRLSFAIKTYFEMAKEFGIGNEMEIILVDYNSNLQEAPLLEQPTFHKPKITDKSPLLRVISVPPSAHRLMNNKLRSHCQPKYWEYAAKNIGLRRACGEYILVTNPDSMPNTGFWKFVAGHHLRKDAVYRIPRVDMRAELPAEKLSSPAQDVLKYMEGEIRSGDITVAWEGVPKGMTKLEKHRPSSVKKWVLEQLAESFNPDSATNFGRRAVIGNPGDFILAPRYAWHTLRGHPEIPSPSRLDDLMVKHLVAFGLDCWSFPPSAMMYHQYHRKSYQRGDAWHGFPAYVRWARTKINDMMSTGNTTTLNDAGWGLGQMHMDEVYM